MDRPDGLSDGRVHCHAQPARDAVSPAILDSFPTLPAAAGRLFDPKRLFASRPWFEAFLAAGLEPGAEPLFFVLNGDGRDGAGGPRALIPCQRLPHGDPSISSLTSFYSCDFRPLIAVG